MMVAGGNEYRSVRSEKLKDLRDEFSGGKTELMHESISTR